MKIAVLASNFIPLPPTPESIPAGYSGAPEMIAFWITEELVKRGHEVTLFASGNSKTTARLVSIANLSTCEMEKKGPEFIVDQELLLASLVYKNAAEEKFDVVHSHMVTRSAFFSPFVKTPTILTIHSPLSGEGGSILGHFKKDQYYVSISNVQRVPIPDLNYIDTIYHGIDLSRVSFSDKRGEYLVFIGRFVPQKGVSDAVLAAGNTREDLILFGTAAANSNYFEEQVKPLIDHVKIQTYGFLERQKLFETLIHAKALLFPIQWEEPFGLVMIEAMACGTPVIAYARGSVPEVVVDGVTGFIVNSSETDKRGDWIVKETGIEGLVEALQRLNAMSDGEYKKMRISCRKHVEEKFTVEKMVEGYIEVYEKVLGVRC